LTLCGQNNIQDLRKKRVGTQIYVKFGIHTTEPTVFLDYT
jgi:hypothetical protein